MTMRRIESHPILDDPRNDLIDFTWNGSPMTGRAGEMVASALVANDVHVFGHHHKDGSPQGLFCANGQCSQCLVVADGLPVKACMTPLSPGMTVTAVEGRPCLPETGARPLFQPVAETAVDVLIIGGGPAGLSAAIELGRSGVPTLIVDDKDRLGGKLVLQTHKFFGSVADSHAGTRGFAIGDILERKLRELPSVTIWTEATAVGVFSDGVVGVVRKHAYHLIRPRKLMVAAGAREKMLSFPGNTLPGVYGAGAFQTLVNRDLIRAADRVLIVGGGNVGLIAGYHAIQAGIEVVGLIEALPEVGGYKVHADKLLRLGVPILTRHTVVAAHGEDHVRRVTIAALDDDWQVVPGTQRTIDVDTVLIAVGLAEVNEFYLKAKQWGMDAFVAGDAQEIAEASAAMFTGRIEGLKIARALGRFTGDIPVEWDAKASILKSRPGRPVQGKPPDVGEGVMPVFHCRQEVPCNPCTSVCPEQAIRTAGDTITGLPYVVEGHACKGCLACVAVCPGLAVTVVDARRDPDHPTVTLPHEIRCEQVAKGRRVAVTDSEGAVLGHYPVRRVVRNRNAYPGTLLVQLRLPRAVAARAAGIRVWDARIEPSAIYERAPLPDEAIVCRCERITAAEIRSAIRDGVRDMNQLKAINRAGMGACGSKTCRPMIWRLFQEEGVDLKAVTDRVDRPLFVEVPLGTLAGIAGGERDA